MLVDTKIENDYLVKINKTEFKLYALYCKFNNSLESASCIAKAITSSSDKACLIGVLWVQWHLLITCTQMHS